MGRPFLLDMGMYSFPRRARHVRAPTTAVGIPPISCRGATWGARFCSIWECIHFRDGLATCEPLQRLWEFHQSLVGAPRGAPVSARYGNVFISETGSPRASPYNGCGNSTNLCRGATWGARFCSMRECIHLPDGLATCEPLQTIGMRDSLCRASGRAGRFQDADAVEDDGQGGCVVDDSSPEGADFP